MCTVDELALAPVSPVIYPSGVAPEFYVLGPVILQSAIDEAVDCICGAVKGRSYCKAVLYLAAHVLAVRYPRVAEGTAATGSGTGVPAGVTAKKTGDESRSFAATPGSTSDEDLKTTRYGRRYLEIRASNPSRGPRFFGAL